MTGRRVSSRLLGLLVLVAGATPAQAQVQLVGRQVASVRVETEAQDLLAEAYDAVVIAPGDAYTLEAIRETLQNLWALGTVADARVRAEEGRQGLHLIVDVIPQLRLYDVAFEGVAPWDRSRMRRALTLRDGQALDPTTVARQAARLQQELADDGYLMAEVAGRVVPRSSPTQGVLTLRVAPGVRARLEALDLEGDTGIGEAAVLAALDLRPGQSFRPLALEEALDRLRALLLDRHYFFSSLEVLEQSLDLRSGGVTLALRVESGPRVELSFSGIEVEERDLHEQLALFEFGTVDDWALKESRHQLVRYLQERGHWRPLVSYTRARDAEGRNVEVQYRILAGEKRGLERIEFQGNEAVPAEVLEGAIRTRTGGLLSAGRFITGWWEQDQQAVVTAYRRRGFLAAEIVDAEARVVGGELVARMAIAEGPRTRVAEFRVDIETPFPTPGIDTAEWIRTLEVRAGTPHDPTAARRDTDRLRALLTNSGYPRAVVTHEIDPVDEDEHAVRVVQRIFPGERVRIDRILVSGNEATHTDTIRRELRFVPGSPYSFADILETQSRLYRTGLFDEVDVTAAEPDSLDPRRSMIVRVHEAPALFINYGGGYDTEEKLRGIFAIGHENVFGGNQEVNLSTRVSLREQRVRLLYREPYLFGRRLEATATSFYSNEQKSSFDVQRWGGSLNLLLRRRDRLDLIWRYSFRDVQTSDIQIDPRLLERQDRSTRVGAFGAAAIYDTRLDPIDPRTGSYLTLDVDVASEVFGSAANFVTLFGRSFWYFDLHDRLVLALAGRAGFKLPYGATANVPLPERFFAGGSTTLRGFPYDGAGPVDSLGNPLGGEVMLIGNVEARVALWNQLGAAVFFDWGNVFAKPADARIENMREILGIGARYETPVGPVRLDFAWLLDRRPDEDRLQLFVSVGHTF